MQLPLALIDPVVVEEVNVALWREVFDALGWPPSLTARRDTLSHEDLIKAFNSDELSDELIQAFEALNALGTQAGCEAIASVMRDRRVPAGVLPTGAGEAEFALHLFLTQRDNESLQDVFVRARLEVEETVQQRRYNDFLGKEARIVVKFRSKGELVRHAIQQYCIDNDLGDHVQVHTYEDDGLYVFQVIHSHRTRKPVAVMPGRVVRGTIEFRPVHADLIRYDANLGRLRIAARAPSMVEPYRKMIGDILFADPDYFGGEPVCSLDVLVNGRGALEHGIPGVGRVWMTECTWERGDRSVIHVRSTDCFRDFEELQLNLGDGRLVEAKLKMDVVGSSARPVTIGIRTPSRITVSRPSSEPLVDRVLTKIGIKNAKRVPRELDLWTLRPWRHPISVWRALFGRDTEHLIQQQVLQPIQLDSIPHQDHRGAGQVLDAQTVSPGEFQGVSRAPEIPSRALSATDLDGYALQPELLRQYLRTRLEISGSSITWVGGEALDLGVIEIGELKLHFTYALDQLQPATVANARSNAAIANAHSVLLMPVSRAEGAERSVLMLPETLPVRERIIRAALEVTGLGRSVPAIHTAPPGSQLIMDLERGSVWFDGVPIPGIKANTHPFRFIEKLVRAVPRPVSGADLSAELSGARKDGDTTARQAASAARKCIREALTAAGRSYEGDPFPSVPNGRYKCAVQSHFRDDT